MAIEKSVAIFGFKDFFRIKQDEKFMLSDEGVEELKFTMEKIEISNKLNNVNKATNYSKIEKNVN